MTLQTLEDSLAVSILIWTQTQTNVSGVVFLSHYEQKFQNNRTWQIRNILLTLWKIQYKKRFNQKFIQKKKKINIDRITNGQYQRMLPK